MQKKQGFTLIEILVAMTIVVVLSVIGMVAYTSLNKRSRDAKRKSDLEQVRSALEMYRTDKDTGSYPGVISGFLSVSDTVVTDALLPTYLPSVPFDPKGSAASPLYFYSPVGASAPYYQYCLCGTLEAESGSNACGVSLPNLPGMNCNYGIKNP